MRKKILKAKLDYAKTMFNASIGLMIASIFMTLLVRKSCFLFKSFILITILFAIGVVLFYLEYNGKHRELVDYIRHQKKD